MVIRLSRFNTYLCCLALLVVGLGCQSAERQRKQQTAAVRIHLETHPNQSSFNQRISVLRGSPITINVSSSPIISENEVTEARVIEDATGFVLRLQLDRRGAWLLEQYSASNPGKRLAIYAEFGAKPVTGRWLAAPVISRRIADGVLVFTPDADREELKQIESGLNNVARKTQPKISKEK
ncbi:MAG: hypothetical protein KIS67_14140 [Verrucomicrobiae bacterium]|nr:hypothetical protein [Verrucomicrobiae bacterium]